MSSLQDYTMVYEVEFKMASGEHCGMYEFDFQSERDELVEALIANPEHEDWPDYAESIVTSHRIVYQPMQRRRDTAGRFTRQSYREAYG
jgi:hypothetical protein